MYFLKVMLFAFLSIQFISCDNEPLTGEFNQEDDNEAEIGEFKALVEGEQFVAGATTATLSSDNDLVLTGTKIGGEKIALSIRNASVGTFSLSINQNSGAYFDTSVNTLPYISSEDLGGTGQLVITEIDTELQTITGTFNFIGNRIKLDSNGDPVLDGNGDPVLENIEITNGIFNTIDYTVDDSGGNGGNSLDEFFAKVDGVDFIADSISVTEPMVGNVGMLKIEALNNEGALLRIDIPKSLTVGTYDMVNISDGTKLISLYNAGGGAENLTSNPGTITITDIDLEEGILKATFAFTGNDPLGQNPEVVEVTEGSFTANFEGVEGGNNMFSAMVDGVSYNPDTIAITTDVVNQFPTITISTTKEDQNMTLTFPATITEGTFDMSMEVIEGGEIVGFYTPMVGTSITFVSMPGTITISNYNLQEGNITGTFSFSAIDSTGDLPTIYTISEGSFYIEIP